MGDDQDLETSVRVAGQLADLVRVRVRVRVRDRVRVGVRARVGVGLRVRVSLRTILRLSMDRPHVAQPSCRG